MHWKYKNQLTVVNRAIMVYMRVTKCRKVQSNCTDIVQVLIRITKELDLLCEWLIRFRSNCTSRSSQFKNFCYTIFMFKFKHEIHFLQIEFVWKLKLVAMETRDWSPKFATGLNMIIDCISKSIWVIKLSFCQNYPLMGESYISLVTHIIF